MTASYDDQGNYIYPEGFDHETGEWREGYDEQRAVWEQQYAVAHTRWEAHKKQIEEAQKVDDESGEASTYSSQPAPQRPQQTQDSGESGEPQERPQAEGSLASDEALQALREKLTGGQG
jgi:small subunit ribosomal protein S1